MASTTCLLQAERFLPYYFFGAQAINRPLIQSISSTQVALGSTLNISYIGTVTSAVLTTPAAITHQNNMNQVTVKLVIVSNADGQVVVQMPPTSGVVAPPGWYMLWVLNGDLPCVQASWVQLKFQV